MWSETTTFPISELCFIGHIAHVVWQIACFIFQCASSVKVRDTE